MARISRASQPSAPRAASGGSRQQRRANNCRDVVVYNPRENRDGQVIIRRNVRPIRNAQQNQDNNAGVIKAIGGLLLLTFMPVGWVGAAIWFLLKKVNWLFLVKFTLAWGFGFGIILWYLVETCSGFVDDWVLYGVPLGFGFLFALMICCSKIARCTLFLSFLELFSTFGRFCIVAFIGWIIATYPMSNSIQYAKGTGSGAICVGNLVAVQSKILAEKMFVASKEAVGQAYKKAEQAMEPLHDTVHNVDSELATWETSVSSTITKLSADCAKETGNVFSNCNKDTDYAMKDCKRVLGGFSIFCKPVSWGKEICQALNELDICALLKPTQHLTFAIQVARHEFVRVREEFKMHFVKSGNIESNENFEKELNELNANMTKGVDDTAYVVSQVLSFMHIFALTIPLILIPASACCFLRRKIHSVETGAEMHESILRGSATSLIVTYFKVGFVFLKLCFHGGVLFLEIVLCKIAWIVYDFGMREFVVEGSVDLQASVKPSTLLSTALSKLMPEIDVKQNFTLTIDASLCFPPIPSISSFWVYAAFIISYATLIVATCISSWILRYRHDVYEWFYGEEED